MMRPRSSRTRSPRRSTPARSSPRTCSRSTRSRCVDDHQYDDADDDLGAGHDRARPRRAGPRSGRLGRARRLAAAADRPTDHCPTDHRAADDRATDDRAPTPAPVAQLGVVSSLDGLAPLAIPPTVSGFPLVALGDSVMLGAAEELQARGFQVDALQSRQMKAFVPTMQTLKDNGTFGSVVVVHLGTNGGFSQETLDAMLATVADVPVVLLLTGKADRGWIADNNAKLRAVPSHAFQRDRRRLGGAVGRAVRDGASTTTASTSPSRARTSTPTSSAASSPNPDRHRPPQPPHRAGSAQS
jgi:hypothetical protein